MRTSRFGSTLTACVTLALTVGGLAATVAPAASAATCQGSPGRADLDGNGGSDTVVGIPFANDGHGVADVRYDDRPDQMLSTTQLGGSPDDNDQIGTAVAVDDLDGDGCADLIVGAPGEGANGGGPYTGQVHIVFGAPGGVDTGSAITLPHPTSAGFDRFGAALALGGRGTSHELYVGAPEAAVNGRTHAGEVFRYTITAGRKVTLKEARSQDSAGVPGAAEADDRFGSALATGAGGGVLVGDPGEDVGSKADAGAVWLLREDAAGTATSSLSWSQDSAGVPGTAETGDHFGAAVGGRYGWAVVGVPGENDGSTKDTGMIQIMRETSTGSLTPGSAYTQDSPGVPGAAEAGDRFGAAVAVGVLTCQESVEAAAGAPGEDVGSHPDAGTVTLIPVAQEGGCTPTAVRQGHGLAGGSENGDQVGSVLSLRTGDPDAEEDYVDTLLLGVPLEDIGTKVDAGLVQPSRGGLTANGAVTPTLQYPTGYLFGDRYGMVLTSPSGD